MHAPSAKRVRLTTETRRVRRDPVAAKPEPLLRPQLLHHYWIVAAVAAIGAALFSPVAASPADDEGALLAFHDLVVSVVVVQKCDPNSDPRQPFSRETIAAVCGPAFRVLLAKEEATNPGNARNNFNAQLALALRMDAALGEANSMIQEKGCDAPEVRLYLRH